MSGFPLLEAEDHRMDVAVWLRGLGLEQYAPAFHDNAIDGEVLRELTADDLKDLGVTLVGHRRKLLAARRGIYAGAASANSGMISRAKVRSAASEPPTSMTITYSTPPAWSRFTAAR